MIPLALVTQPIPIFFIVLGIILLAPLLLNRLKIPHIIGMIVAGVIIGPYGFDVLSADSSFGNFRSGRSAVPNVPGRIGD